MDEGEGLRSKTEVYKAPDNGSQAVVQGLPRAPTWPKNGHKQNMEYCLLLHFDRRCEKHPVILDVLSEVRLWVFGMKSYSAFV